MKKIKEIKLHNLNENLLSEAKSFKLYGGSSCLIPDSGTSGSGMNGSGSGEEGLSGIDVSGNLVLNIRCNGRWFSDCRRICY